MMENRRKKGKCMREKVRETGNREAEQGGGDTVGKK